VQINKTGEALKGQKKIAKSKTMYRIKNIFYFLIIVFLLASCTPSTITINDSNGVFSKTNAPVSVNIKLSNKLAKAAQKGHLRIVEPSAKNRKIIPVQLENINDKEGSKITFLMPEGNPGIRKFVLMESKNKSDKTIQATVDTKTGQIIITENDKNVLQYNYQTVYEKDVVRSKYIQYTEPKYAPVGGIYLEKYYKAHPGINKDTVVTSQIYAVPRSDYIHPLFGLNGEMLTCDWSTIGHPHHRGIFWAWPEVMYGTGLGDIYALQRIFARPTGNIKYESGNVFAEIIAENLWEWDNEPIVREIAAIRVYRATPEKRIIDLTLKFVALKDSVTIATRETNSYGGLNVRLQSPDKQDISYFTGKKEAKPQRAWSDFNGIFKGNNSTSGLMILQHAGNPEYPGEWRDYPGLAWVQPTFPTPNTRYLLSKTEPLILRYRLIIHNGGKPGKKISEANWDAYNLPEAPVNEIGK
jgi:hypothetical protein